MKKPLILYIKKYNPMQQYWCAILIELITDVFHYQHVRNIRLYVFNDFPSWILHECQQIVYWILDWFLICVTGKIVLYVCGKIRWQFDVILSRIIILVVRAVFVTTKNILCQTANLRRATSKTLIIFFADDQVASNARLIGNVVIVST